MLPGIIVLIVFFLVILGNIVLSFLFELTEKEFTGYSLFLAATIIGIISTWCNKENSLIISLFSFHSSILISTALCFTAFSAEMLFLKFIKKTIFYQKIISNQSIEIEKKDEIIHSFKSRSDNYKVDIKLPEKGCFVLNKTYTNELPKLTESLFEFGLSLDSEIQKITTDNYYTDKEPKDRIESFLFSISFKFFILFFGYDSNVRIHWRWYNHKRKRFEGLSVVMFPDKKNIYKNNSSRELDTKNSFFKSKRQISDIPSKKASMISASYRNRRSLIMSYNSKHHYPTDGTPFIEYNGKKNWCDYLTATFGKQIDNNLDHKGCPVLSLGISISKDSDSLKNKLVFLNHIGVEGLFAKHIKIYNNKYSISEALYGNKK